MRPGIPFQQRQRSSAIQREGPTRPRPRAARSNSSNGCLRRDLPIARRWRRDWHRDWYCGHVRVNGVMASWDGQVLRALGEAICGDPVDRDLQAIFEREVRLAANVRAVRLREIPARYHARLVTPARTPDSIILGVPSADPRVQATLEATFESGSGLTDPQRDVLADAAQLGGLVLEATRAHVASLMRPVDAAGPLVGSSGLMQALRGRIERVALTDFTVLIEGESGTGKEL